jgi:hypothetical protein
MFDMAATLFPLLGKLQVTVTLSLISTQEHQTPIHGAEIIVYFLRSRGIEANQREDAHHA